MPSPLSSSPYNSRNLDYPKYSFVAFKPGTPLQASELNELQENINYQNSETMKFLYDIASGDNYIPLQQTSGIPPLPVPTSLNQLSVINVGGDILIIVLPQSVCLTINSYYKIWTNPTGLDSTTFPLLDIGEKYTFKVKFNVNIIPCSLNPNDPGYILNDNSGGASSGCGADRLEISARYNQGTDSTLGTTFLEVERISETEIIGKDTIGRKRVFNI